MKKPRKLHSGSHPERYRETQPHQEDQSIGRLISILHRQAQVYFHHKLGPYGLGHGQMPVLMYIVHHEGVTQHNISQHFHLDRGSTSSLIKGLEAHGFVYRQREETDRRVYRLYQTGKTQQLLPDFYAIFRGWTEQLLEGFTDRERELAFDLLNRMLANACRYEKGEGHR